MVGKARVAIVIKREYVGVTKEYRPITSVPTYLVYIIRIMKPNILVIIPPNIKIIVDLKISFLSS